MTKDFDDTNWKQEILGSLGLTNPVASKLLKNGASLLCNQYTWVTFTPDGRN